MSRLFPVIAIGLLAANAAHGQLLAGIGSSARGTALDGSPWQTSALLSSSARFDTPFANALFDGAAASGSNGLALTSGTLSTSSETPAFNGFRLFANASVNRDRSVLSHPDDRSADVTLSYKYDHNAGAWLGYGANRFSLPSFSAGFWHQLQNVTVSVQSRVQPAQAGGTEPIAAAQDSVMTDSGLVHVPGRGVSERGAVRKFAWAETEGRIGWSAGPIALDGLIGWRPRIDSLTQQQVWYQASATAQLSSKVGLSVGGGTIVQQSPFTRSQSRFLSVALKLSPSALMRTTSPLPITPSAASFAVHRAATGEYVVVIRVPKARVVELAGDFNQWKAVRLEQVRPDEWQATLSIGPGTYRMNLRVDGERWIAPPGTVIVDDDFNGRVGLVVVR